jgi:RNA polymerase sigma-70 factor (ECF subfamily)
MRSEIEQAILLLRRGDDEALEHALALLQNTVFSFSMKVCGQRQDAEDTMQDVLVKSVPYLPKFDSPKALAVWLLQSCEESLFDDPAQEQIRSGRRYFSRRIDA